MNSIEIKPDKLKDYLKTSKSVKFTVDGCKIPGKRGKVFFDLSEFNAKKVFVHLKRISGNGQIIISGANYIVSSKTYQTFDIDINNEIEIVRPVKSTGEVVLLGLTLPSDNDGSIVKKNWKNIINKCGKYSNLRLVNNRLFASTGGFIEDNNCINEIQTNPPNIFIREGNKLKFKGSCEITSLSLNSNATSNLKNVEVFVSRKAPTTIVVPQPNTKENKAKSVSGNVAMLPQKYAHQLPNFDEHILYDSSAVRSFKAFLSKTAKQIRSNRTNYLVLGKDSQARASMSNLRPNTSYICIVNAKKLSGNGRLFLGISADKNYAGAASEAIFSTNFTNKYIKVTSGNQVPNSPQNLHLFMPSKFCNGEVLIQRIILIEDLGIENAKASLEGKYIIKNKPNNSAIVRSFEGGVSVSNTDKVYASAKRFAIYKNIKDAQDINANISGNIIANNVSGVMWAKRVQSVVKSITIGKKSDDSLLIAHLGAIQPCNRIWIEPFDYHTDINEDELKALSGAKKVFTPSMSNAQILKSKLNKEIIVAHKPLPWVRPESDSFFQKNDFVLTFERNYEHMKDLYDCWNDKLPTLVVAGARGKYPDFVIPLNEYYPYRKFLYLLKNAKFIIDLTNISYHSSILDMANQLNKNIISTNWFSFNRPNCIYLPKFDKKSMSTALNNVLELPNLSGDVSIDSFKNNLNKLFT